MNYSEAIQFLYGLQIFGANFGLENTLNLAALAGNPQTQLRFIHVAGTNGKGSTCAMLESIYRATDLRVGLFTSPHLVSFRERIQVNRQLIPESEVVRLVEELRVANKGNNATLFEFATVMALKFFAEQKCDLVIWETGLGGRLDATNIVTPLASVITNIAFDHQQWLGDTLEKIAAEKAGIIKPGIPVVTAAAEPSALAVIEKIAREKNAPLKVVNRLAGTLAPPLLGDHQKLNAALALATVDVLQNQIPIVQEKIREGLATVNWLGRLQLIQGPNGQTILLDGAHNIAGASVLRKALENLFPAKKRTFVLGILQDKNWREICGILAPLASRIFTVPISSERSANPDELATVCRLASAASEVFVCSSLREALQKTSAENFVVVTGSLYLVGEALELLGLSPAAENERALNEWNAKSAAK
ncbi:MAG: folylpolyglutamate synthase/dihydrofolate synthase family protein [Verrucomicrobiota bacterium]